MSSTYAGNAANYPENLTFLTDGDPSRRASTHRPGLEGLADRTANVNVRLTATEEDVDLFQAFNFPTLITGPAATSQNGAFFSPATGKWYVLANTEDVRSSVDGGITWSQETGVATAGANEHTYNGDSDASGNVVIATATQYVFELNASTSTWAKRDARAGAGAWSERCVVVHDPVHSVWILMTVGGNDPLVSTSTNRSTWTGFDGGPASFDWVHTKFDAAINKSTGRVVMMGHSATDSSKIVHSASDDGGVTWSAQETFTTTITGATTVSLTYSADEGAWYFTIGSTTGTPSCEVWRSTDGITFTKKATLTAACIHKVACNGTMLIGVATGASRNHVVYSRDQGVTWNKTGRWPTGTLKGVFYGGGRPIVVTSSNLYVGLSKGSTDLGSLT